ncbi:MAG TPA: hypothetical protein VF424_00715 [Vicinamibacterales bacterium]
MRRQVFLLAVVVALAVSLFVVVGRLGVPDKRIGHPELHQLCLPPATPTSPPC